MVYLRPVFRIQDALRAHQWSTHPRSLFTMASSDPNRFEGVTRVYTRQVRTFTAPRALRGRGGLPAPRRRLCTR